MPGINLRRTARPILSLLIGCRWKVAQPVCSLLHLPQHLRSHLAGLPGFLLTLFLAQLLPCKVRWMMQKKRTAKVGLVRLLVHLPVWLQRR